MQLRICDEGVKRNEDWNTPGSSVVSLQLITAIKEVGIQVIVELCYRDLDSFKMTYILPISSVDVVFVFSHSIPA